jgi:magnesium-transporting ATPase (P-type)
LITKIAKNDLENRDSRMSDVESKWETNFHLIGATAIEDRLQDQVPETIEFMRNANIKVWVLTGDKVDTAKNIGYSCRLLTHDSMKLLEYPKGTSDLLNETHKLLDAVDSCNVAIPCQKGRPKNRIRRHW